MALVRHNWPIGLIAVLALLAIVADDGHAVWQDSGQASAFATAHYQRCMQSQPDAARCTLRTVQLASQLGGLAFGDQVATELR